MAKPDKEEQLAALAVTLGLSTKERDFCLLVASGANPTKAAIQVGYAPKGAHVRQNELRKRPAVKEYLLSLKAYASAEVADRLKDESPLLQRSAALSVIGAKESAGIQAVAGVRRALAETVAAVGARRVRQSVRRDGDGKVLERQHIVERDGIAAARVLLEDARQAGSPSQPVSPLAGLLSRLTLEEKEQLRGILLAAKARSEAVTVEAVALPQDGEK